MTTRDVMAKAMSEDELLSCVIDLARALGYRVAHFRPARTAKGWRTAMQGDPGWPDLVMAKDGRVIFAELKSQRGRMSHEQWVWFAALASGCYLWRPSDWLSGEVELILKGEA